jgi:hypothetical protein
VNGRHEAYRLMAKNRGNLANRRPHAHQLPLLPYPTDALSHTHLAARTPRLSSILPGFDANRQISVVECREQLKVVGLLFIMIDEERRLVYCDHLLDFFHRRDRFCLIGIEGRDYIFLEILFQMSDVAGQDDEAGILEMD